MSELFEVDPATIYEISRRVDSLESEVKNIRQKHHEHSTDQNSAMIAICEIDNNITNLCEKISKIYHNQKYICKKLEELEKSYEKIEKKNTVLDFIISHWKVFAFFGLFFIILGIGLDEIINVSVPERIIHLSKEANNVSR